MMARAATAPELAYFRSSGQHSKLALAIPETAIVFKARVDQVFNNWEDREALTSIEYDAVTVGAYGDIVEGQTLYIGHTEGAYDIGMARIRSATSSILTIGAIDELDIDNNDYLTVVNEFNLWAKPPLEIDNGDDTFTLTIDTDVAYSDQHDEKAPVPVMGPDMVVELSGATVDIQPTAAGSWELQGGAVTYQWAAPGSDSITDDTTHTPTITYSAAGTYHYSCVVTGSGAATWTGRRVVYVWDTNNMPETNFKIGSLSGDWEDGGWGFRVKMYANATRTDIRDRAKVILFATKEYYGGTNVSIGPITNYEHIIASGWIAGETIEYNPNMGTVEFEVQGPHWWLKNLPVKPLALNDTYFGDENATGGAPTTWHEFEDMTVDDALWHIITWRSTISTVIDVPELSGETAMLNTVPSPAFTIFEQLREIASRARAWPCCDRYGRLYIEEDSNLMLESDRGSIPTVMDITGVDWHDTIQISRLPDADLGMVELTLLSYLGGQQSIFCGRSPGDVGFWHGNDLVRFDDIIGDGPVYARSYAGLFAGKLNNEYPDTRIPLSANNRLIDIAPKQYVTMTISDDEREIAWSTKKLIPREVTLRHDLVSGSLLATINTEGYTTELNAVNFTPPGTIGGVTPGGGGTIPRTEPPDPDPAPVEVDDPSAVVVTASEIRTTEDITVASPIWTNKTGSLASETFIDAMQGSYDKTLNTVWVITEKKVYLTTDLSANPPTWTEMFDADTEWTGFDPKLVRIMVDWEAPGGRVWVLAHTREGIGSSTAVARCARTINEGASWTSYEIESKTDGVTQFRTATRALTLEKESGVQRGLGYATFERDDADDADNPWAMGYYWNDDTAGRELGMEYRTSVGMEAPQTAYLNAWQTSPTHADGNSIPHFWINTSINTAERTELFAYLTTQFGDEDVGWTKQSAGVSMPNVSTRVRFGCKTEQDLAAEYDLGVTCYVIWRKSYWYDLKKGWEFAYKGDIIGYYTAKEEILRTPNAGNTWYTHIVEDAYDLASPMQQTFPPLPDRDIGFITKDGDVYLTEEQATGASLHQISPNPEYFRTLMSDPGDRYPVYALDGAGILSSIDAAGSTITLGSGYSNPRSLYVFTSNDDKDRMIYFLDENNIYYSEDRGETISSKKGSYTGYTNPICVFPLVHLRSSSFFNP